MSRPIVPMSKLDRRLPEQGRIRFGEKGPKGEPRKLNVFRFTSHDEGAIREIASRYGGTPMPWSEMPGQWQVTTESKEIPVVLPPDALGDSPVYELWAGGGVLRRCDGEVALVPIKSASGAEMAERPCVCAAQGQLDCKPKTRLTVILPDVRFGGGWRIESGGWNVAQEMPGMVDMIASLQQRGLTRAMLALEPRVSKFGGLTRKFVVPVLRPAVSLDALMAGEGQVRAIAAAPSEAAKVEVRSDGPTFAADDEILEAEIVEPLDEAKRRRMHVILKELGMGETERHALTLTATRGRSSSSSDLTAKEQDVMLSVLTAIRKGEAEYMGQDEHGAALVKRV